jgi:hypothetical protein
LCLEDNEKGLDPFPAAENSPDSKPKCWPFNCWGFVQPVLAAKPANIPQRVLLPS